MKKSEDDVEVGIPGWNPYHFIVQSYLHTSIFISRQGTHLTSLTSLISVDIDDIIWYHMYQLILMISYDYKADRNTERLTWHFPILVWPVQRPQISEWQHLNFLEWFWQWRGNILKLSRSNVLHSTAWAWYPHYLTYRTDLRWRQGYEGLKHGEQPSHHSYRGVALLYLTQSQSRPPPAGYSFNPPRLGLRSQMWAW